MFCFRNLRQVVHCGGDAVCRFLPSQTSSLKVAHCIMTDHFLYRWDCDWIQMSGLSGDLKQGVPLPANSTLSILSSWGFCVVFLLWLTRESAMSGCAVITIHCLLANNCYKFWHYKFCQQKRKVDLFNAQIKFSTYPMEDRWKNIELTEVIKAAIQ